MQKGNRQSSLGDLPQAVIGYLEGDKSCAEIICFLLTPLLRATVCKFLGPDSTDTKDVTQETLMTVLNYLTEHEEFVGDLTKLAVTIANNRCRDILRNRRNKSHVPLEPVNNVLQDKSQSPLDCIMEEEICELLHQVLDQMTPECRNLLRDFYFSGLSIEEIRNRTKLSTVQGVYFRRTACLQKIKVKLEKMMVFANS